MELTDDDLALILEGKAEKLRRGEKSRTELRNELAELLTEEQMPGVLFKRGPLQAQGRVSFGRSNEGEYGLALFTIQLRNLSRGTFLRSSPY